MSAKVKLSIVIAVIPSRMEKAWALYQKLTKQVEERLAHPDEVEVLFFMDNKRRSIGKKRQSCIQLANGTYVALLDDDDDVTDEYIFLLYNSVTRAFQMVLEGEMPFLVDVITFNSKVTNDKGSYIVSMSINHPDNEETGEDECGRQRDVKRKAWHLCAWKTDLAQAVPFADVGYGEDWHWAKQLNDQAKTEIKLHKVIHHYIENPATSEAPTHSNEIWTSPADQKKE